MISMLQRKLALSRQGAMDLVKGCLACALQNIALMLPVMLLYLLVKDLLGGGINRNAVFYGAGCAVCLLFIFCATYVQYNSTYFATYIESGVRRVTLAEQLRKFPLSFFSKKDLSDLTGTLMADCTYMETAFSHFIPELAGSFLSTAIVAVGLFCFDWRMALAALWVLPVSFAVVLLSAGVQDKLYAKSSAAKLALADGIQEFIETVRDLKSNNSEDTYLAGLDRKINEVEKQSVFTELGTGVFLVSAGLVLKLGIATVALVGSVLLSDGSLDLIPFSRSFCWRRGCMIRSRALCKTSLRSSPAGCKSDA